MLRSTSRLGPQKTAKGLGPTGLRESAGHYMGIASLYSGTERATEELEELTVSTLATLQVLLASACTEFVLEPLSNQAGLNPGRYAELSQDIARVESNGALTNIQRPRNLAVGFPFSKHR